MEIKFRRINSAAVPQGEAIPANAAMDPVIVQVDLTPTKKKGSWDAL